MATIDDQNWLLWKFLLYPTVNWRHITREH